MRKTGGSRKAWPDEIVAWLQENVPGKTTKEVTELINRQDFGMTFTEEQIKGAKRRYGIASGTPRGNPKGFSRVYPAGMEEYIRSIAHGKSSEELAAAVNTRFGAETIDARRIKAYKKNHGINTGLTGQFQKGHEPANKGKKMTPEHYAKAAPTMFKCGSIPANHLKVGQRTHTTDGYLVEKVSETGKQWERFAFVHRMVWEAVHGPIPAGKMIIFLDGDKDNVNIDNLAMTDNAVNLEMNRSRLRFDRADLTEAGKALAELKVATRTRKKKGVRKP